MLRKLGKFIGILLVVLMAATPVLAASSNIVWLQAGQGRTNWRSQPLETTISSQNVANLSPKWTQDGGDVSAMYPSGIKEVFELVHLQHI